MYTLVVADDHPLFRDAITAVIQSGLPGSEVREADCFAALLASLAVCDEVDLALLDLNLPDVAGLDGLKRLRERFPEVPVAILSAESDRRTILDALELGAVGYLPKSTPRPALLAALNQILGGQVYLPADILRRPSLARPAQEPPSDAQNPGVTARLEALTDKQMEVLTLLIRGASNKVIARELAIAETTVKTHVSAILRKLGVQSRVQAILAADEAALAASLSRRRS